MYFWVIYVQLIATCWLPDRKQVVFAPGHHPGLWWWGNSSSKIHRITALLWLNYTVLIPYGQISCGRDPDSLWRAFNDNLRSPWAQFNDMPRSEQFNDMLRSKIFANFFVIIKHWSQRPNQMIEKQEFWLQIMIIFLENVVQITPGGVKWCETKF